MDFQLYYLIRPQTKNNVEHSFGTRKVGSINSSLLSKLVYVIKMFEHVVVSSMRAFVVQLVQRLSISFAFKCGLCTDAINTSSWRLSRTGARRKPFVAERN